jgi:A/G-specific adenine glycosylase
MNVAHALLRWYDRERRDLPWRRSPSPYRTLVSELMLQQTVVATVVPYFERFVARFPDLQALADAAEDDVLAHWSGLGYYSRARNLHRAARAVMDEHGGALPPDEEALRRLPGVGPYTAAAVAAIAFDRRTFALDGNAASVMARLTNDDRPIDRPAVRDALRARGLELVPVRRAGDFAQAVMELGARVCVTGSPRCEACPVSRWCQARAAGTVAALPARSPRRAKRVVRVACVAVERAGRVLLVRRAAGTLLGGTWTLPAVESRPRESDRTASRRALAELGLRPAGAVAAAGEIRHVFTHRDVTARVLRTGAAGELRAGAGARWVKRDELRTLGLATFTYKTLALLA